MTRRHPYRRPVLLIVTGMCCLAAALLGGPTLVRMTIALVVLLTANVVDQRATVPMTSGPGPYPRNRMAPRAGSPRYDEIVHHLTWTAESAAYRRNVLEPWLQDMAQDLGVMPPAPGTPLPTVVDWLEREVRDERP